MKTLIEKLQEGVADWTAENFSCGDFPAIVEILEWASPSRKVQAFVCASLSFRAHAETYWFLRLIEDTPKIADLYEKYFPAR